MNFNEAAEAVKKLPKRPSNDELLQLYSYFKQGSDGDVQGKRPGMVDFKGRAKYDSWAKLKGMDQEEAKTEYVKLVSQLIEKYNG